MYINKICKMYKYIFAHIHVCKRNMRKNKRWYSTQIKIYKIKSN